MEYIINHSDAKALFVDNEFAHTVLPVLDKLTQVKLMVNICDAGPEKPLDATEYEALLASAAADPVPLAVDDEYAAAANRSRPRRRRAASSSSETGRKVSCRIRAAI